MEQRIERLDREVTAWERVEQICRYANRPAMKYLEAGREVNAHHRNGSATTS